MDWEKRKEKAGLWKINAQNIACHGFWVIREVDLIFGTSIFLAKGGVRKMYPPVFCIELVACVAGVESNAASDIWYDNWMHL